MVKELDHPKHYRVLILDPEDLPRRSLALSLEKRGYCAAEAGSELEALKTLCEEDIDVVLVNLNASNKNSISLLRRIKQICSSTQIILLRNPSDVFLAIEGMRLGALDDLVFPIDLELLISRVKDGVNKKRNLRRPEGIHIWYGVVWVA